MNHRIVPPGLSIAVAKQPFNKPDTCTWEAIDPLTKFMLRHTAGELLTDTIPALIKAGWTPPTTQGPTP